jgi:hypothetical protein
MCGVRFLNASQPSVSYILTEGCSDLRGFPSVDHAIFTNVSGRRCDSGVWDTSSKGLGLDLDQGLGPQVFKQASCVPDADGICPTSIRLDQSTTKLWIRCGGACWHKLIQHTQEQVSDLL